MARIPLQLPPTPEPASENEVFFCPEESHFYSHCLERLVFNRCSDSNLIVEFGCGDGTPVIYSLVRANFAGRIYGYELNPAACHVAQARIRQFKLQHQYIVHNQSFYNSANADAQYLIANPPYIPAPDNDIRMPLLHGGFDGAKVTNSLLFFHYPNVMVLVSSYSNPLSTLTHAMENGYSVADFMIIPLQFGYYSSEPKVKHHIATLRRDKQAFYSGDTYLLAGVLFRKFDLCEIDMTSKLTQLMTAL